MDTKTIGFLAIIQGNNRIGLLALHAMACKILTKC
jgi:hypothetical protein